MLLPQITKYIGMLATGMLGARQASLLQLSRTSDCAAALPQITSHKAREPTHAR